MRYVAAYLLAVLGGNTKPSAKDIKTILGSVGIEAEDDRLNKARRNVYWKVQIFLTMLIRVVYGGFSSLQVINELNGKNINEVMNSG